MTPVFFYVNNVETTTLTGLPRDYWMDVYGHGCVGDLTIGDIRKHVHSFPSLRIYNYASVLSSIPVGSKRVVVTLNRFELAVMQYETNAVLILLSETEFPFGTDKQFWHRWDDGPVKASFSLSPYAPEEWMI